MKKSILILMIVFAAFHSSAQFQITGGPSGAGSTSSLAVKDTTIFAGTATGGVFLSTDNGNTWTASNNGLTNLNDIRSLVINDTTIFAGIYNSLGGAAVFKSTDLAANWTPTPLSFMFVLSLAVRPSFLIAGTWSGVSVSTNNGTSWNSFQAGLPSNASVAALAFSGTKIFAGVSSSSTGGTGVFASVNNGTSWTAYNSGLTSSTVINALIVVGTEVFAGTQGGVYKSGVTTSNWSAANTGLTSTNIRSFHAIGNNLFAGTGNGIFFTANGGTNWNDISSGLPGNTNVYSIGSDSLYLYVGTDSVVWRRPFSEITGINENTNTDPVLNIHPNPSTKDFLLTVGNEQSTPKEAYELNLFNLVGVKVLHRSLHGENTTVIDVSSLPAGIYFVRVTDDAKKSVTKKMVKH